jgi:hypothetical protein
VGTKIASNLLKVRALVQCLYKLEFTSSNCSPRFTKDWVGNYLDIVYNTLGNIIEGDTLVFENVIAGELEGNRRDCNTMEKQRSRR